MSAEQIGAIGRLPEVIAFWGCLILEPEQLRLVDLAAHPTGSGSR
jgi:hypothetical protein